MVLYTQLALGCNQVFSTGYRPNLFQLRIIDPFNPMLISANGVHFYETQDEINIFVSQRQNCSSNYVYDDAFFMIFCRS